ncbi:MAG: PDZ domain-containing protein [Oscillospiraceae bacterium]|nr:PDZ domain-containing protein [Oscillospiraceae bacterium]
MNKKISVNLAVAIAIIAMTVTFSITMILSMKIFDKTVSSVREKEILYNKLAEIDKRVRAEYYGTISDETLFDMISVGYMAGIGDGKNAKYYTAKQYAELLDIQDGKVVGVGVEVIKQGNSYARVIEVYPDSPAALAGIQKNFTITKIGDIDVKPLTLEQIQTLLRGEQGTELSLTYLDAMGAEQPPIMLRRTPFERKSVEYLLPEGKTTGYVKITSFNNKTAAELDGAVSELRKQGATSLVFDVRNNEGGLLDGVVSTIDVLCPEGAIGSTEDNNGEVRSLGLSDASEVDLPMVVLTNGKTASAAELFASAIRDFGKGKIVGTKTYGKGTVQCAPQRLSDSSAISFTTGKLLTAKGESFDGVGIVPDEEIALKPEEEQNFYDLTPQTDSQIARAFEVAQSMLIKNGVVTPPAPATSTPAAPSESAPAAQ